MSGLPQAATEMKGSSSATMTMPNHFQGRRDVFDQIHSRVGAWLEEDSRVMRKETSASGDDEEEDEDEEDDEGDEAEDGTEHNVTIVISGRVGTRSGCRLWAQFWEDLGVEDETAGFKPSAAGDDVQHKDGADDDFWNDEEVVAGYPFVLTISAGRTGQTTGLLYDAMSITSKVVERDGWKVTDGDKVLRMGNGSFQWHFSGGGAETTVDEIDAISSLFDAIKRGHLPGVQQVGIYYDDESLTLGSDDDDDANDAEGAQTSKWSISDPDGGMSSDDKHILARGYELWRLSKFEQDTSEKGAAAAAAIAGCKRKHEAAKLKNSSVKKSKQ